MFKKPGSALARLSAATPPSGAVAGGIELVDYVNSISNILTLPSTIQRGHLLIIGAKGTGSTIPATPTGFTSVESDNAGGSVRQTINVFWKIADGTEPASLSFADRSSLGVYRGARRIGAHAKKVSTNSQTPTPPSLGALPDTSLVALFTTCTGSSGFAADFFPKFFVKMGGGSASMYDLLAFSPSASPTDSLGYGVGGANNAIIAVEIEAA